MAGRLHIWCLFLGCTAAACSLIFCFVVVLVWEKGAWQTSKLWPLPTSWRNEIKHRSLIYSFALLHFLTFFFSKYIHLTFDWIFFHLQYNVSSLISTTYCWILVCYMISMTEWIYQIVDNKEETFNVKYWLELKSKVRWMSLQKINWRNTF